ncbi:protein O-glucosyltransferase 2 [Engraulis encrasicolus]|uniref:protein O-glucosyltransferase 2 n=1 Tax=Engraulis encrasicolus TaxID=184585 RepID=UPI002FD3AA6B
MMWKKPLGSHSYCETASGSNMLWLCVWVVGLAALQTAPGALAGAAPCPTRSLVWGPGLEPKVILPARYFFIQAADSEGRNLTSSPGEKTFEVKIWSPTEPFSRVWVQVLDRSDGSFVVRYRMYASYTDLHIQVLMQDQNVAQSPYVLKGAVCHEGCDCPEPDGEVWAENMHCPASYRQIDSDLLAFPEVHLQSLAQEIPERYGQRQSLCHYTIIDNKVYIKTHGEHVGFRIFMDAILLSLTRKVRLPDMEFFVNLGDWPLEKSRQGQDSKPLPIFSWCGSNDTHDIVMPTYDLTESVLETMGRVSLDMLSVQGNSGPVWANKNSSAIWRGRDSRRERLRLVEMSRAHPDMLDAALTHFFFFKHDPDLYGPLVKHMSFFNFFKYKYQINIDGTVAAYRLPYLLAGGSVVLKQDSPYYEHFYSLLSPWQHYIPFKADLSDLLDQIRWARNHDDQAKEIALAGQEFARTHLMGDHVFCYYFRLFQEYAKRQVTKPEVREGMELVEQPKDDLFPCYCPHTQAKDEL